MKIAIMHEDDLKVLRLKAKYDGGDHRLQHLLFCYETMFENACDPNSSTIEFKPEILRAMDAYEKPRDMIIFCPACHKQHIDKAEPDVCELCGGLWADHQHTTQFSECKDFKAWINPPHKSHRCHFCNAVFRPADFPTNGVAKIETRGENDTFPEVE